MSAHFLLSYSRYGHSLFALLFSSECSLFALLFSLSAIILVLAILTLFVCKIVNETKCWIFFGLQ